MLRSAKSVGVVSVRLSKTLIRPFFSATKIRPSGEKRRAVGFESPLNTTDSWNPGGSAAPALCDWPEAHEEQGGHRKTPYETVRGNGAHESERT